MKKLAIICFCIFFAAILSGCIADSDGYTAEDLENARREGYEIGFKHGVRENSVSSYDELKDRLATESDESTPIVQPEPDSGTILSGSEYNGSEITVTAASDSSYVVLVKDSKGEEQLSFFVRAGDTVTIGVPSKYLYVYFASGSSWYGFGQGLMFGDDTIYTKDDELLDFTKYSWEYTLYPVYDGNFSETPSNEVDFFE